MTHPWQEKGEKDIQLYLPASTANELLIER